MVVCKLGYIRRSVRTCRMPTILCLTFRFLSLLFGLRSYSVSVHHELSFGERHLLNLCWANLFWIFRRSTGSATSDHSEARVSGDMLEAQCPMSEAPDCSPSTGCPYDMLSIVIQR